jgi:DEAD/DEAH box helicase domain-containing protein
VSTITPVPPAGPLTFPAEPPAGEAAPAPADARPSRVGLVAVPAGSPGPASLVTAPAGAENRALGILLDEARAGRPVHVEHIPARAGRQVPWPPWVPAEVIGAFAARGISAPWSHQAAAASHAQAGRSVIISTAAASGKSLGYLLPALTSVLAGGTVLYITPTKALAADQLASIRALGLPGVQAATFDGDSTRAERDWARSHARYLLTTPDMLHRVLLPRHARWSGFFSRLRYVIIDECHGYRGVFGSHVGHVLRRLRRVVAHHAAPGEAGPGRPVFVLASATVGTPGVCARLLTGLDAEEVTDDGSPRGPLAFALWEPPLTDARGEAGARLRRTATAQAADLLSRLVRENVQTLAFIRSRRGAEAVALAARRSLDAHQAGTKVAAYRSGYLPEDRRRLEAELSEGRLVGLATTTALELGVNITGLDAVLIAGWPGTWASLWQQAGRAGRSGRSAAAVLIARDDPLDTYLVRHPELLLRHPVEATVLDPGNPYVLAPHLCAAAAELPLTEHDLDIFGPAARPVVDDLTRSGRLRRRPAGWFSMRRDVAAGLRGAGLAPVRVVEEATGRLVGTVDEPSAHLIVHDGAVYVHQGESYLVRRLDLADRVALVEPGDPGYTTTARNVTELQVSGELRTMTWGEAEIRFGDVQVTRQVVSFARRRADTGAMLGETPLDLPPRQLRTRAVWWTVSAAQRDRLAAAGIDLGGAAHAAEHASIGLLPLFATCDRWDVGGVSADLHAATGRLTVFVYDGHDGGAGFAERGFNAARDWLGATRQAISSCGCEAGCPSCVQSPKCGNANHPLSKRGAVALLDMLLRGCPQD